MARRYHGPGPPRKQDIMDTMRCLRLLLCLFPALAGAQNLADVLKQGEDVFAKSCAAGYCHGPKGAGGGAPRLSGRGFDQAFITNTVTRGVPGTAMASFTMSLSRAELIAVVAYVATLNGISNPAIPAGRATESPAATLSGEAARGHDLFFDAVRGFGRCATCHEVNGVGIPVTTPVEKIPGDVAALRALATPAVATVTMAGEKMPALIVSKTARAVMFYDLTTPPPVLRTVEPNAVQTAEGSSWKHSSVIAAYNEAELASILAYLRAAAKP
jgi:mono/diheme cytochrome c family protein